MKYFIIFFALISVAYSQLPVNECGDPNAVPTSCGSSCPLTCENYDSPPQVCIAACSQDPCECKSGYILDSNKKCILPSDCPKARLRPPVDSLPPVDPLPPIDPIPLCPENETLSECPRPCTQDRVCNSDVTIAIDCPLDRRPFLCRPSCVCEKGYVREVAGGRCILPGDCPIVCDDPNAEVVDCPNPCPATCDQLDITVCLAMCLPRGCQCKKGYVLNSQGKCVLPKECPPRCGPYEVWNPCVTCRPDRTCLYLDIIDDPICRTRPIRPCKGRCQCIRGYVRDNNGNCVPDIICIRPPIEALP